jgi:predicted acylesterase/phospholipase RssA
MLRSDLPFKRIAVVLSGGGAFGAYEVGVLRVLDAMGLRPAILAGTSAGAINAVVWLAHDFATAPLVRVWRHMRSGTVGIRWNTLAIRIGGALLTLYALIQALLTLIGSPGLTWPQRFWFGGERGVLASILLDALAWFALASVGIVMVRASRSVESWLASLQSPGDPGRARLWFEAALLLVAVAHLLMWGLALPWPHRFSATLLAVGLLWWLLTHPRRPREPAGRWLGRLLPETRGRGLWGDSGRRRLLRRLVAKGDPSRLVNSDTLLIMSALALDNGRITHFASGPNPGRRFETDAGGTLSEVVWMKEPAEVMVAAIASSAIPLAFEPVRVGKREFVDAGQFSNQPLDAAVAAGADAILVVLTAPSTGSITASQDSNLIELGARLLEVATWRQLNIQLEAPSALSLREGRRGIPALLVVEPQTPLPGGLLGFDTSYTDEILKRGEADARRVLEEARWLDPDDPHAARPKPPEPEKEKKPKRRLWRRRAATRTA